jgi:lipopolysaccharide assembly outer membrane protein LptD (OstA)
MLFGATTFSQSAFADPGGLSVQVVLNGVQMNFAIGNVQIIGKSVVLPTGERVNLSTGNVVIKIGQTVLVTGEELALATDTVDVISWNPIIPGATGVWIPIDPNNP